MKTSAHGFTLIEIMIVVAIVAVLSAIALPLYRNYQARAAENACLAEMKMYTSTVTAALATEDLPSSPLARACATSDTASIISTTLTGTPRPPGLRRITCNVATSACTVEP